MRGKGNGWQCGGTDGTVLDGLIAYLSLELIIQLKKWKNIYYPLDILPCTIASFLTESLHF